MGSSCIDQSALRRRSQQAGVATVEAVVALVFFILLYWSVIYVGRLNEARAKALVEVRGCAWMIAARGCGEVPDRCRGSDVTEIEPEQAQRDKFDPVHQAAPSGSASSDAESNGPEESGAQARALDAESQSALTTEIDGLLFQRIEAKSARPIERPPLYGGGTVSVGARYTLPCNSRPGNFAEQVTRIWNAATN